MSDLSDFGWPNVAGSSNSDFLFSFMVVPIVELNNFRPIGGGISSSPYSSFTIVKGLSLSSFATVIF